MSFLDKVKSKAQAAVDQHGDKISSGLDKAAKAVDDKTKGKYSDKIDSVQAKAHDVVGRIAADKGEGGADGSTPPADPPGV